MRGFRILKLYHDIILINAIHVEKPFYQMLPLPEQIVAVAVEEGEGEGEVEVEVEGGRDQNIQRGKKEDSLYYSKLLQRLLL